ncbi:NAD-dependent epimerase/dehydratase family protein, partial [bacterium]|nr:NAD-dependent epimerase/dehydratase family protein [bacterium]
MSKTILVTGGAGFIGSNFVRRMYQEYPDYRIVILDALTYAGSVKNLPIDLTTYTGDRISFWYG